MASNDYSFLAGDSNFAVNYVDAPSPNDEYPEDEFQAMFGAISLPRVYGKNLSAFEVASSGLIAFTVDDVHTLNVGRQAGVSNQTYIATVPDESLNISLGNSNASIWMDAENSNMTISASNELFLDAPNGINFASGSNMALTPDGELLLSSGDPATTEILLTPEGDMTFVANNDMSLTSSNDLTLYAESNVTITAQQEDIRLSAANDNVWIELDHENHALLAFANSNVDVTASNDMLFTAKSDIILSGAGGNSTVSLSNDGSVAIGAQQDVNIDAGDDLRFIAADEMSVDTNSNITLSTLEMSATASNLLTLNTEGTSFGMDGVTKDVTLSADSNVTFTAGQTWSAAGASNAILSGTDNVTVSSTGVAVFEGEDTATLQRGSGGDALVRLNGDNTFSATADDFTYQATQSGFHDFFLGSSNIVRLVEDKMTVNGNLDVMGVINSISVQETQLEIQDKTIRLAFPGNDSTVIEDGPDNTAAGVLIHGFPTGVDSNLEDVQDQYQKSLKWYYNGGGIDDMMTRSGIETEAYWEMRGGSFRLAAYKSDGTDISFGLRINENDELEFVKHWTDSNAASFTKRIAKMGRHMSTL
jgi:uncharacterized protein (DUF2345 family)